MCLYTNQLKPKIAKKDIVVYKHLYTIQDNNQLAFINVITSHLYLVSPIYRFTWLIGKTYVTKLKVHKFDKRTYDSFYDQESRNAYFEKYIPTSKKSLKCNRTRYITQGFHTVSFPKRIPNYECYSISPVSGIYKCIIPAGSEYYTDKTGLVVSNKLMITNEKITKL